MRGKSSIEEGDAKRGFYSASANKQVPKTAKHKQQNKAGDIVAYLFPRAKRATDIKTQTNKSKQHTIMVLFEPSYGFDCA